MDTILYGANEDIRLSIHLKHITLIPIDTCNLNKILSLAIIIIISLILRPIYIYSVDTLKLNEAKNELFVTSKEKLRIIA